ncbi:hypothetical protein ES705_00780 [subsurface metagenome]|nr:diguanylate cyclase [Clostridia bacterium]
MGMIFGKLINKFKAIKKIVILTVLVLALIWSSEIFNIPYLIFGAPSTIINWQEASFLTFIIISVGILSCIQAIELKKSAVVSSERVKELECFYNINNLSNKPDLTLEDIFYEIVKIIPSSWQYPDITCCRIIINNRKYKTDNFKKTKWRQSADIVISGKKSGTLEVCYLKRKPYIDEGPFFKGERLLIDGISILIANFFEKRKTEEKLKYISFHDKLTGLYNRFYLEEEIARLDTKRQLPISIVMGDLNALKLINDAFGYRQGDRLLIKMAKILKKCFREEDIIARWGGDEFVILLPKTTEEDAVKLVERIREDCQKTTGQKIPVSISIGISTKTRKSQNIQDITKKAEDRMYQNKLTESRSIQSSIISSLEITLWERSHETEKHGERLKELALKLGRVVRLAPNELDELSLLSTLHDIGKIGIEDSILTKPGKLTEKEWVAMKRHPEIGYKIAQSSPQLLQIADGILYHHERWDGTGYPHGLTGENIPLISRIVAIADAYDIMTRSRLYKKAVSKKKAIEELKRCSGTQFDPKLVDKLIDIIGEKE